MSEHHKKDYEMLAYILSGKVRRLIYFFLCKQPESYAYEIANNINVDISYVTRSLRDLIANKVVQCLNPDSQRRKFYKLTPTALKLKNDVKRTNNWQIYK